MFLLACKTTFVLLLSFYFVFFLYPVAPGEKIDVCSGVKASGKKEAFDLTFYSRCHIFYGTGTRMWSVLKHSWRRR